MTKDKTKPTALTPPAADEQPSAVKLPRNKLAPTTIPTGAVTFGAKVGLHQRVAQAQNAPAITNNGFAGFANMSKIMIFPDCSGSMASDVDNGDSRASYRARATSNTKIDLLKDAVDKYLDDCSTLNFVGVASFPEAVFESPTGDKMLIRKRVRELTATGSTPLSAAMGYVIDNEHITHGVIISDGVADSPEEAREVAKEYKQKGIKLDCVFIGDSGDTSGEQLLKDIAETTGGVYIKFSDVNSFAKSFQYLAPAKRSMLTQRGSAIAGLLGAAEVKI